MRTPALLLIGLLATGCDRSPPATAAKEVTLYTSVDAPVARPIVDEFTKRTGIKVLLQTDTEASKTAGLAERLRAERANPRADVFWNNEPFHAVRLAGEGVLAPYESPAAKDVPAHFKDPQHRWAANALRTRVIALRPGTAGVATVEDLAKPELKGKVCMANPAFGTTSGHVAALFVHWGPQKAEQFLQQLKANDVRLLGGNSEVVKQIAGGNFVAGLTDNDDVDAINREGGKVASTPAKLADGSNALAIPCTVALVAGAKNGEAARQLIDYLLSAEVERKLIDAKFANASVRDGGVVMKVDYARVAEQMPAAVAAARRILEGRE